ncbi:MAG: 50S ribosomal protein L23 [Phycisphaerae bacterium]
MDPIQIIVRPLITEKSTKQQDWVNAYAFEVHRSANKVQIKDAVEKLYNVKVAAVKTLNRKGKPRRTRTGQTHTKPWKKAMVQLADEQRIELF